MKKTLFGLIVIFIMIDFSGCVSPNIPQYKIDKTDNVGYIIKTNPKMIHTYEGLTVFNNFEKEYPKLVKEEDVGELLKENLEANLINLSSYDFEKLNNLIVEKNGKWSISDTSLYDELVKKYNLKAIVIVSEKGGGINLYPSDLYSKSSGLITKADLLFEYHIAVSGFRFKLNILNPKGSIDLKSDIVTAKPIYLPVMSKGQEESGFKKPKNIESLTVEEQHSIKKSILELTKDNIEIVNEHLSNM